MRIFWGVAALALLLFCTYCFSEKEANHAYFDMPVELKKLAEEESYPMSFVRSDLAVAHYRKRLRTCEVENSFEDQLNLALQEIFAGENDSAILTIESLQKQLREMNHHDSLLLASLLESFSGLAWQRKAEDYNCRLHHKSASCILPLSPESVYKDTVAILTAIEHYKKALQLNPGAFNSRWLLNVAHAVVGKYPAGVPDEYFIPFGKYDSADSTVRFQDIASEIGVNSYGRLGGNIIEDFNKDGLADLFSTSYYLNENVKLFLNSENGRFIDVTENAGLTGITGGSNCVQADYNNDGFTDILIVRGGWLGAAGVHPKSLLRNNGDGTFTDVTAAAGLLSYHPSQSACWADFNRDGWLDLFVGNEHWDENAGEHFSELFINQQDGTFKEQARQAGIAVNLYVKGVSAGDIDNDGFPDLYLSCFGQPNLLFHNRGLDANGNLSFSEIARQAGVADPLFSFPCMFFDYNNDGYEDIFVTGYFTEEVNLTYEYVSDSLPAYPPKLYRNRGNLSFEDVTESTGLGKRSIYAMGLNYADVDNDGWLDFYAGTGYGDLRALWPNLMFRNVNGKYFNDITRTSGTGHLQKGHAVSFGDIDNDGDSDLFLDVGGFLYDDCFGNVLFLNKGNSNNWIGVKLEGDDSNRSAIGARVKLTVETADGNLSFFHTVSTGASFGSNSLMKNIGLGKATIVDEIVINWPSGKQQKFKKLPANNFYSLHEDHQNATPLEMKKILLEGYSDKVFCFPPNP